MIKTAKRPGQCWARRNPYGLCVLAFLLALTIVLGVSGSGRSTAEESVMEESVDDGSAVALYRRGISYEEYRTLYEGAPAPGEELTIDLADFVDASSNVLLLRDFPGAKGEVLITEETGFVEWEIEVATPGLYNLKLSYYPMEGKRSAMERELQINGECPFSEAKSLTFSRVWGDAHEKLVDQFGNEIRARQEEKPCWRTVYLSDSMGYHDEPYRFYFQEGLNRVRLVSHAEPMAISELVLCQAPVPPDYAELERSYAEQGYQPVKDIVVKIQGEDGVRRSSSTLFPVFDQGDPTVEPYHPAQIRLNTIGGYRWAQAGQWITWEFEVPRSGLYKIAIKGKQDEQRGFYSSRKLLLDGRVPFAEMKTITFPFSQHYQMQVLGDDEPYLFYLEKGRHELELQVVLGDLTKIIRQARDSLYELNTIYRRIIMITSPNPDPLRSYQLELKIPGLIDDLREQGRVFRDLKAYFQEYTGQIGTHTAFLEKLAVLLERMANRPYTIPDLLDEYKDNIGALGEWITTTERQPLQIDYIIVAAPKESLSPAAPTVTQTLAHEIRAFFHSFFHDYTRIGSMGKTGSTGDTAPGENSEALRVWIGLGRDQAQLLKQMIEDSFTPETGIPVELELVENMGSLLIPATIAGSAPDVAIGAANMELAFRGALMDLCQFPDFSEVARRFKKSAFVPFRFRDKVYALPEMQGFPVMFYRQDILTELGLDIPQTWEDVHKIIPVLQRHHMQFGLAADISTMLMFLYQKGIALYKEDGIQTNLDSETAVRTFIDVANFFTIYDLPLTFNVENRFRLGEMPLVIASYGLYNTLKVFAPELRGEWAFAPVPGTVQPDGTINRTVPVGGTVLGAQVTVPPGTTGAVIMDQTDRPETAWEFLKWWTRQDTQVRFGLELESLMGDAARYATANVEALKQLPWKPEELDNLLCQWDWVEGVPPVLGSYYVSRQFDWLFRAVVINNEPVRESVQDYDRAANLEIARKRQEFGLETDYHKLPEEAKQLYWDHYTHVKGLEAEE